MMRKTSLSWIFSTPPLVACLLLHAAGVNGQDTLRDSATGARAALAEPVTGTVPDPNDEEDVFLEEYMNYQMKTLKNWRLRLFAAGSVRYDSNVFLRNTTAQHDVMWSARPGFQYSYGDEQSRMQILADYSAQFNFFEKFDAQNSLNQFLSLSTAYRRSRTTIKLSGRFNDVTGGDLDVGGQAQRVQFSPDLQVMYEVSEKVRVGISGQLQRSHYDALLSSTTWRFGMFADYAFSPQFRLGMQFNEMLLEVQGVGLQTGQDYLARVEWDAFKKLSLNGTAGAHVLHTFSAGDTTLPSGSLGFRYAIGPKTSLTVNAYARAQNSPSLAGLYFQSQGVTVGLQQQLGSKLNIGVDVGYDHSAYGSYLAGVASSRVDRVKFARPWLKYTLHRHLSLELFYQHTTNDSQGTGAQAFKRSLVGAGLTSSW